MRTLEALAASLVAAVTGTSGLFLAQATSLDGANQASVTFGPSEIAVVSALLLAVVGALSLVFRLLLSSKQDQIDEGRKRIAGLEMLLSQASTRSDERERRMTEMVSGSLRTSEEASREATRALQEAARTVSDHREKSAIEHAAIVRALEDLTSAYRQRSGV